jgi:site-specific DNA-methyltransferase (adenine-specific)
MFTIKRLKIDKIKVYKKLNRKIMIEKERAKNNRTLTLTEQDRERLKLKLLPIPNSELNVLPQGSILGDCLEVCKLLPKKSIDLLFLDPPYNLTKSFDGDCNFKKMEVDKYTKWLENVVSSLKPLLKDTASIYICGDWFSSVSIYQVASSNFIVRNRITWEREKGRGAKTNWKNSSEDIWFCTMSNQYTFNVDSVKLRRKVIAPYKTETGEAKDWDKATGYRDTHPSNLWTDITIPFWSMTENTDHPTQKSEKLLAKLILASSNVNDFIFDPFLGSGTTSVAAKKLGRKYLGIDLHEDYCLICEKRLESEDTQIQGYSQNIFWERNSLVEQKNSIKNSKE